MPSVTTPAKVLVSGANGFIAIWVVRVLLDHGFSVRAAVRSENKTKDLRKVFKDELNADRLELVIVPDITAPGAFDEAVQGVDAIEHTASPFYTNVDDPNELLDPAIKGTVGILESALKHAGPQLKRIVVTSSVAAVMEFESRGILNESFWNEGSPREVQEKGKETPGVVAYTASKALAEKAAWDFASEHKQEITWDLVTICPPWIWGPVLNDFASPTELGTSSALLYDMLTTKSKSQKELMDINGGWVDVRDVAEGHVRSLEVPEAGGQRFILCSGMYNGQELLDAANLADLPNVFKGVPGSGKNFEYQFTFDNTKARAVLSINFRDLSTTCKDAFDSFKEHGWLSLE